MLVTLSETRFLIRKRLSLPSFHLHQQRILRGKDLSNRFNGREEGGAMNRGVVWVACALARPDLSLSLLPVAAVAQMIQTAGEGGTTTFALWETWECNTQHVVRKVVVGFGDGGPGDGAANDPRGSGATTRTSNPGGGGAGETATFTLWPSLWSAWEVAAAEMHTAIYPRGGGGAGAPRGRKQSRRRGSWRDLTCASEDKKDEDCAEY
ncbi:hypothetical protein DFH08DRAFT_808392 [Mycena albidolilacea]|uniref:Uncharacterized protein n=1 Tax=Mycena albidolilacea TaxID=1033008 RepID=A0AAD7A3D1_9AGAR|nr:hypothetical protein DFH08DRAFT_808392 [Mycena albidolilacea]